MAFEHNKRRYFYMVECCEIFKMAISKIPDFLRRLKIRSKTPARYEWESQKSFADTLPGAQQLV